MNVNFVYDTFAKYPTQTLYNNTCGVNYNLTACTKVNNKQFIFITNSWIF